MNEQMERTRGDTERQNETYQKLNVKIMSQKFLECYKLFESSNESRWKKIGFYSVLLLLVLRFFFIANEQHKMPCEHKNDWLMMTETQPI